MSRRAITSALMAVALVGASPADPDAQLPARLGAKSGLSVSPVFEGWYPNSDGTVSLSFGYYNRNAAESLAVPIGPANSIAPGPENQGQPSHFEPGRHWGVFAVTVPAGTPDDEIVWTLAIRGERFSIPGHQRPNWRIDALEGEAGSGNTPPALRFEDAGPEGAGPFGLTVGPRRASAGSPVDLTVWARDDGRTSGSVASTGREAVPISLTWFTHQGPAAATFTAPTARVPATGGSATTAVTFAEPGEYVLRVRANDASGVSGAGHAQCCWTNGFVKISVGR